MAAVGLYTSVGDDQALIEGTHSLTHSRRLEYVREWDDDDFDTHGGL